MSNVFSEEPVTPSPDDVTVDTFVGEGRKYSDPNGLAKAYAHADARLAELQRELAIRDQKMELLEAQMSNAPPVKKDPPVDRHEDPSDQLAVKNDLKDVDLSKLIKEELSAVEAAKDFSKNVDYAAQKLADHLGGADKANEFVRKKAAELGVSVQWLMDVAGKSPNAFLSSVGVTDANGINRSPGYNPERTVRSDGNSGKKGWKHFEEIRKSNKNAYYSPAVQKDLMEARKALGNDFYNL